MSLAYYLRTDGGYERREPMIIQFPGGEPHVQVTPVLTGGEVLIDARVANPYDFVQLLALTDALRSMTSKVHLFLPYFPGARQDRQVPGWAFTARVYVDVINLQKYDSVTVLDPHSDVVPALLERVIVLPASVVAQEFLKGADGLICPDAGAEKRTYELAAACGIKRIVFGRKHRDARTGRLSGFSLDNAPEGGRWVVVDDICDGGGTFLGLREEISDFPTIDLWTTHGIYSKGFDGLAKAFRKLGSTDSFSRHQSGPVDVVSLSATAIPELMRRLGWVF